MLTSLNIKNIILIDSLEIEFDKGLCVLTGETGAGKSILLDALGFALGDRASKKLLKHDCDKGMVTASFQLDGNKNIEEIFNEYSLDIEDSKQIILRRVILKDGKTKAYVNDLPISINLLGMVAQNLIEIHGQNENKKIFDNNLSREYLDKFCDISSFKYECANAFKKYKLAKDEYEKIQQQNIEAKTQSDYLKFVVNELQSLDVKQGEEQSLDDLRTNLVNRDKILSTVNEVKQALEVESNISSAQTVITRNLSLNNDFENVANALDRCLIEIAEVSSILDNICENIDENENSLDEIEERLFSLRATARKYNVTIDKLPEYCNQMQEKLSLIDNFAEKSKQLEIKCEKLKGEFINKANLLSKVRQKSSEQMKKSLEKELVPLKMDKTKFKAEISQLDENYWSENGIDEVKFLVQTNPGVPFAALTKIASGGELSRFMLALKVIMQQNNSVPCMIFDEVDTGIGGAVADAVGKHLKQLSNKTQVLVVTHQPQVASVGDLHFKIAKIQSANNTKTSITKLNNNQRQDEIARMLAGEVITEQARQAAISLLNAS